MFTDAQKLEVLSRINMEINEIRDIDMLMEQLLFEARKIVNADAGSLYISENGKLHFKYSQNDTLKKRLKPNEKLIYSSFTIPLDSNSIAGHSAVTGKIINIEDAYNIPSYLPYRFSSAVDKKTKYETRSMLAIPMVNASHRNIGVLQLINAKTDSGYIRRFVAEDELILKSFASIAAISLERAQLTRSIILRMIQMAELRDPKETGAHVIRVGGYAVELYELWAKKRGIQEAEIRKTRDILRMAAMLHDVGKVAISDLILRKPGIFTAEEYEEMKFHTVYGASLFLNNPTEVDKAAMEVALNHHERWDGKGYPGNIDINTVKIIDGKSIGSVSTSGKSETEIPLFGRIVALADVYDALMSARIYKEAWDEERVLENISENRGSQFDPELVDLFLDNYTVFRSIRSANLDLNENNEQEGFNHGF
ncbi:MAG: phosphohydrolase [Deltaproteobacteria bacterium]|nr:MAG: phosphohydrolase [Deltaproteobacteria bacterium]